jgi:hypothetical protein
MGTAKSGVPIKTVRMAGQIVSRGLHGNNESRQGLNRVECLTSGTLPLACTIAACGLPIANTTYGANLFAGPTIERFVTLCNCL